MADTDDTMTDTDDTCQSPRQNAKVNLLAKLPMSIPWPKCTIHEPLTPSPARCPRAGLIQNCPTLEYLVRCTY